MNARYTANGHAPPVWRTPPQAGVAGYGNFGGETFGQTQAYRYFLANPAPLLDPARLTALLRLYPTLLTSHPDLEAKLRALQAKQAPPPSVAPPPPPSGGQVPSPYVPPGVPGGGMPPTQYPVEQPISMPFQVGQPGPGGFPMWLIGLLAVGGLGAWWYFRKRKGASA